MFGAEVNSFNELQLFKAEKIGNAVGILFPKTFEEGMEYAAFCRTNQIHFIFREAFCRDDMELPPENLLKRKISNTELKTIIDTAGEYYHGRMIIGESGGMLYWPHEYLREPFQESEGAYLGGPYPLIQQGMGNTADAENVYLEKLRNYIEKEKLLGGGPFWDVDGSIVFKHHLANGINIPYLEMMCGNPERMTAAVRGAAKAFDREFFGTLIAFGWYGGGKWDELYLKRWKCVLYYAWLSGYKWIISESGHFGFSGFNNNNNFNSQPTVRYRETMREFYEFSKNNQRCASFPETKIGILYGHLDGYPGLWTNSVWGQYENDDDWRCGDAEKSWALLDEVYRRRSWQDNLAVGEEEYSGNPPQGTYDIVPAETTLESLRKYSCLIMLGWNTMTKELYNKLTDYVRHGGKLIAGLPHLSTNTIRNSKYMLINNGDFSDLFGVVVDGAEDDTVTGIKFTSESDWLHLPDWSEDCDPKCMSRKFKVGKVISGNHKVLAKSAKYFFSSNSGENKLPVVIENSLGKGKAVLVNAFEYPGSDKLYPIWKELLYAAMTAEQPQDFRVIANDKIRYAMYSSEKDLQVVILNTDFDLSSSCKITNKNDIINIHLEPLEIKIINLKQ
jgi:hypothetical protein